MSVQPNELALAQQAATQSLVQTVSSQEAIDKANAEAEARKKAEEEAEAERLKAEAEAARAKVTATMLNQYENVLKENTILNDKINTHLFSENKDKQDVDDEKSKYLQETILNMRFLNNCLFGIYFTLFVGLAYTIYNKDLDIRAKIALFLLFLLYPFYISALQDNLRFIYNFLFSSTTNINTTSLPESNELINNNTSNIDKTEEKEVDYNALVKENSILETKVTNNKNDSLLNSRNSMFTAEQSEYYKTINSYLFILYYLCALGFVYVLFATAAFPFNIYLKITLVVLLAGYPYYVDMLVIGLIYILTVLYKLIMGQPYKDSNAKYDTVVY
jgi:cation transport ATPase